MRWQEYLRPLLADRPGQVGRSPRRAAGVTSRAVPPARLARAARTLPLRPRAPRRCQPPRHHCPGPRPPAVTVPRTGRTPSAAAPPAPLSPAQAQRHGARPPRAAGRSPPAAPPQAAPAAGSPPAPAPAHHPAAHQHPCPPAHQPQPPPNTANTRVSRESRTPADVSRHSHRAAPRSDVPRAIAGVRPRSMADRQQDPWPAAAAARQNVVSWRTC